MEDIISVDKNTDLVYSSDDNGFYFQLYLQDADCNTKTSQVFNSQIEARQAYQEKRIVWED